MQKAITSLDNDTAVKRLTALWALSESGIGGVMFALKIPFTGFLIGAISLTLLSLIAKFSNNNPAKVLGATVIVLIIKATVSPHSPFPAYLAVSFQGLAAAVLFRIVPSHRLACILTGMITMVESALQKLIVLTVIFGKELWTAFNNFVSEIGKTFSFSAPHNYAFLVAGIYLAIYLLWGALVGAWASGILKTVARNRTETLDAFERLSSPASANVPVVKKSRSSKRFILYGLTLAFILAVFLITGAGSKQLLWIFLRSVAAVLLLFVVLRPIIQFVVNKWLQHRPAAQQKTAADVLEMMPRMRGYVSSAYQLSKQVKGRFRRFKSFLLNVIILSLYAE